MNAFIASVLYCDPKAFAEQLVDAADGVYFGKMDDTDKTVIKTMPRARTYFHSPA